MAAPIRFESSWQKEIQRQELRDAREKVLEKAKARHDREEQKKAEAHARGDDVWMLPALSERLEEDKKVYEKSKKKKKKEKKKKKKKEKKAKKKKKKESSSSSSDSESEDEDKVKTDEADEPKLDVQGPKLQRDDWMTAAPDFFPSVSRQDLKDRDQGEDKPEPRKEELPGQNSRELNPYWKDGGTGMPSAVQEAKKRETPGKRVMGDCGLGWLKKAYQRCITQAEERGCSADEVAAERYGSMQNLKNLIAQTELKLEKQKEEIRREQKADRVQRPDERVHRVQRPEERRRRSRSRERPRFQRPDESRPRRSRSPMADRRSKEDDRVRSRFMRPGEGSNERYRRDDRTPGWKKKSYRDERGDERKEEENREEKRGGRKDERRDERKEEENREEKRGGRKDERRDERRNEGREERRRDERRDRSDEERVERREEPPSTWKQKSFSSGSNLQCISDRIKDKKEDKRTEEKREQKRREKSPSSESSSSSESEVEESSSSEEEEEVEEIVSEQMTEKEMNDLGAKIIKAELMGDEELCKSLKEKMELGRQAKTVTRRIVKKTKKEKQGDNVVVLTRTDKHGISRPLPERSHPREPTRGRRKREKVKTHDDGGVRERYFQDDDKHDLKTLVARERMGTAEDSDLQFAKLAGRVKEHLDDDEYNVDDALIQKASKKQSESRMEDRDRHMAIMEHKTMSKALSKCQHCFENIPKHLIIAIGMKVYLCLPPHRSLTDGHCLIVPMQHVAQATVLDEDVWQEIQIFRKGLTAMFGSDDEDCVFMETCMRLNKFPHMVIECIPLPRELGDMAPIYFKKALLECEKEWSQNKKVVDLSQKNIRKAVPKGFPYFSVDFGLQGGFAHVIEEENEFPYYFGREIVGGMLDKEPSYWRKPHRENFEQQRSKVLCFAEMWKPYDWTKRLGGGEKESEKKEESETKEEEEESRKKHENMEENGEEKMDASSDSD